MVWLFFIAVYDYVKGKWFVGTFSNVHKVQMIQIKKDCNLEKVNIAVLLTFMNVITKTTTTDRGQK